MYAFFLVFCCFFFFFKQKTAYEMRISDWSSDVCSSDLKKDIRDALTRLSEDLETRAAELSEVASGWRIQVRRDYAEWVARLYQEKPPRLSRAARNAGPDLLSPTGHAWRDRRRARCRDRSEERRVGKECVSKCKSRWSTCRKKKKKKKP